MQATSELLVDDERVVATKWEIPPGGETGHHTHHMDYLVVYLSDGTLTVIPEAGEEIRAEIHRHEVTSRPAGVSHNVLNRSDAPIAFIEIELKRD